MKIKNGEIYYYKRNNKYYKVHQHNSSEITVYREKPGEYGTRYEWLEVKWWKTETESHRLVLVEDEPTIAKLLLKGAFEAGEKP
jgi:hypothetical protein